MNESFKTAYHQYTVSLLAGQRTCDSQVAGSSHGWAPVRSGIEQATYTSVSLSQIFNLVLANGVDFFGRESNRGPGGKQRQPTTTPGGPESSHQSGLLGSAIFQWHWTSPISSLAAKTTDNYVQICCNNLQN